MEFFEVAVKLAHKAAHRHLDTPINPFIANLLGCSLLKRWFSSESAIFLNLSSVDHRLGTIAATHGCVDQIEVDNSRRGLDATLID